MEIYKKYSTFTCFIASAIFLSVYSVMAQDRLEPQIFDDWQVTCGADQPCRMSQAVVHTQTQRLILQIQVFKKEEPTVLLTFPLGILLNTGWQYQIDGAQQTLLPFEICNTEGCHAGVKLSPKLLSGLKRGNTLHIKFFDAAKTAVTPAVSLTGFTKAYEALK